MVGGNPIEILMAGPGGFRNNRLYNINQ